MLYATLTNIRERTEKRSAACRVEAREEAGEKYPGERVVPKLGRAGNYNFPSS